MMFITFKTATGEDIGKESCGKFTGLNNMAQGRHWGQSVAQLANSAFLFSATSSTDIISHIPPDVSENIPYID